MQHAVKYTRTVLICITLLTAMAFNAIAQTTKPDSLVTVVNTAISDDAKLQAYIQLATLFDVKNFDSNLVYGLRGLAIAVKNKDTVSTGILTDGIGWAYYFKGSYDSAAVYYYRATGILQGAKALKPLAANYNNLAKLYRKTGKYDRALLFYNKAIDIYKSLDDYSNLASMYNECGVVFEYQQKFSDALEYYNKSLELKKRDNDSVGIAYSLSFIAGVYNQQQKYADAEKYAQQALAIRQNLRDSLTIAFSRSDLGDIYQAMGNNAKAKDNYTQAKNYISNLHFPDFLAAILKQLSDIAFKEKDYKVAYEYYQQYSVLKDSLFKLESTKQVEELSAKYETAEKEQTIQQQKFQISKRNYYIAGIAGLFLFSGLLGYSFYRRYRLKQQAKLQAEIVHQQDMATKAIISAEETERKRIAGELHDGVGQMMSAAKMNLSAIEDEIQFVSPEQRVKFDKVVALIDESCAELRTVSHNMMPNALLKTGLAMAVREFVDKIDKDIIQISLHAEGLNDKMDQAVEAVLYRVIQECVNNVIKHAQANRLDISLIHDTDGISATVEDNGVGFDSKKAGDFEGIGLKNIKSRIVYLKGTVEWDSEKGRGTVVAIHVPLAQATLFT